MNDGSGNLFRGRVRLKRDDTRRNQISSFAETDESVQSTAGSRGVRISGSNAG